jgi:hypothetical protein
MKTIKPGAVISSILLAAAMSASAQDNPVSAAAPSTSAAPKEAVNYVIRVQWKDGSHLQILSAQGNFNLSTFLPERVKINDSEIPISVSFKGDLRLLSPEKGQLNIFLGRSVPYVTSSYGTGKEKSSSYQQMQVGFQSTFTVTFGKPLVIQSDTKEEVTVLVKRAES